MTVPSFTIDEFLQYLDGFGFKVGSDEHWEDFGFIMLDNGKRSFPLEFKKVFFYKHTVRICNDLGISPPETHLKAYNQDKGLTS